MRTLLQIKHLPMQPLNQILYVPSQQIPTHIPTEEITVLDFSTINLFSLCRT